MTNEQELPLADATPMLRDAGDGYYPVARLAVLVLRHRRVVAGFILAGAVLGAVPAFITGRIYKSTATFATQVPEGGLSQGLAAAATQFGLRVPTPVGSTWGPSLYVELLHSRYVLQAIALDTVIVAEEGSRRASVMDLLAIPRDTLARRVEKTIERLANGVISAEEDRKVGVVRITVSSHWPSLSQQIGTQLIARLNAFNINSRNSQAAAERVFLEQRVADGQARLDSAEQRMQRFLERNRSGLSSPELSVERDRLQRDVSLHQQLLTALLQSLEDAKLREVRDTPVVTVIERPNLPIFGQRNAVVKFLAGGLVGACLAMILVAAIELWRVAFRDDSPLMRELASLLQETFARSARR